VVPDAGLAYPHSPVAARVLHVSDLHVGAHDAPEVTDALRRLTEEISPELVVASGDLTNRGRRGEQERAHALLTSLGPPVLAVPGNHDIPHSFPKRFTSPWHEFERVWETARPTYSSPTLQVVGLNSARPYHHQSGGVRNAQLRDAAGRLGAAAPGAFRIVALHHSMLGAPWRAVRKRPLARRHHVLEALVSAGTDLIVAGHIHQVAVNERRDFEVVDAGTHPLVVSVAPGLGQPRPRRSGEARGLHVYEVDDAELRVRTFIWVGADWRPTAVRTFVR